MRTCRSAALFALSSLAVASVACSSAEPTDDAPRGGRPRGSSEPGATQLATPAQSTIAIASPASGEIFVTTANKITLRGIATKVTGPVQVRVGAGATVTAEGSDTWTARDVAVPEGTTRIDVSSGTATDGLTVVRTRQLGFTEPASFAPNAVVVGKKTTSIVRVPLDPASTVDRKSLRVVRVEGSQAKEVATLRDDGAGGDERAGDGVFGATVELDERTIGRTTFAVAGKGPAGEERALAVIVDVVAPIARKDVANARTLLASLDEIYRKTSSVNEVLTRIRASEDVVEHALVDGGDQISISLHLKGDVPALWTTPAREGTKGGVTGNTKGFFASPNMADFGATDEGPALEQAFSANTCPQWSTGPGLLTNAALTVELLRTVPDYGAIHISSHGNTWAGRKVGNGDGSTCIGQECETGHSWYNGPGTEVILFLAKNTVASGASPADTSDPYSAELQTGRMGIYDTSYFVTPKFFSSLPKRFPNSAVVFSICRGSYNATMGDALIRKGAGVYLGYTEYVGSGFAQQTTSAIWGCLLDNTKNDGQGASLAECLPAETCEPQYPADPDHEQCQVVAGVVSCTKDPTFRQAGACIRTYGDTGLKLPHKDAAGQACTAAAADLCNDGKRTGTEACDTQDFGMATCATEAGPGYAGNLRCRADCTVDASKCTACNLDNVKDPGEECDGTDLGGAVCGAGTGTGTATPLCTNACKLDNTPCEAPPTCVENGIREGAEPCDGTDFGGATCASVTGDATSGGALTCTAGCVIDSSRCAPACPPAPAACETCNRNGVLDPGETCDGTAFADTCVSLGYSTGTLKCDADCRLDASECAAIVCVLDGTKGAQEACDGTDFGGATCASATGNPASTGTLACQGDCSIDTSNCGSCNGDGVKNEAESCEGTDLGGATCANLLGAPHATGTPTCRANCTIDASGCGDGKQCTHSSCTKVSTADGGASSLPPFEKSCDSCTTKVCDQDPHCCTTAWDYACYATAVDLCGCE